MKHTLIKSLVFVDQRYPAIKKNYPGIKYMAPSGERFDNVKDYEEHIKRSIEYRRRKNKPKIEVRII